MVSVVAGLAIGYGAAALIGRLDFAGVRGLPWITLPVPFRFGFGFRATALIPFCFLYLISAIETIGDLTATSILTGQPLAGPVYFRRLRGGVLADGFSSMLAAIFNSFPTTTFAQNNGVIQLTGVGSSYVGGFVGIMLVILGLFPVVGGVVQAMPASVLGGATIIMFGTVAAAGIRILSGIRLDRRASTIIAISIGLGLAVNLRPRYCESDADTHQGYLLIGDRRRRNLRVGAQCRPAWQDGPRATVVVRKHPSRGSCSDGLHCEYGSATEHRTDICLRAGRAYRLRK
jgi:xanthine permease XanP